MLCHNCKRDSGGIMYKDVITCSKCGEHIVVDYCSCHICGYTWRLNNGEFLDGNMVDEEGLEQMLEEIGTLMEEEFGEDAEYVVKRSENKSYLNMSDMIHKCIKCGEIAYLIGDYDFKCSSCGFEWEVLKGEE